MPVGGVSGGEKHGSAPEGTRPLNLSHVALGRLSTSSGSLDWPGRLLHRPALSTQSPRMRPSRVASWDGPAAVPERRV